MAPAVKKRGISTTVFENGYILGLDAGNTVIKAVLFDLQGQPVAMKAQDGQSSTPQPGHVERDLNELWANARQVIAGCIDEAGIDAAEIIGVGCAGHGNGLYLLDKAGEPLIGIQSLDTRAAGMAEEISNAKGDALHSLCLQKPWPSQTPVLLAWIKRHRPEIYANTGTAMLCKDFITCKLTGERVTDISDMSGCGLIRMPDCAYDDDLLALYGLSDAKGMLPRLIDPAEVAGTVSAEAAAATGLAVGTPVIGGYFDVVSSAMGSGVVCAGEASIIAGTWSINQVFSDAPAVNDGLFMVSGFGPKRFVNIEASATSAANLEWYVREFVERGAHHDDPFGYCNAKVAEVAPAADDPFFHPYLYGSGQGAAFRGGFYGVAGWHSEGHMLRALFEGVLFEHRRHIEVLKSAGVRFDRAVLSGGGSRSPVWPQMFADCLGVPIFVAEAQETGALGAAIGVSVATDVYGSYEEAIGRMTRRKSEFLPNVAMQSHYNTRYAQYLALIEAMRGFWDSAQTSTER
ncbi:FGGY-family carbohydrate kinase [Ruegeria sp. Ofav3-42]|uniref:FGGY-family carbohydrate kinase n=1 Tax=Ruegeria sp. Ofav3-42 TaxID=2917759 RepID=UPI001EF67B88|nr:FGGY-family carbohydrate kinase [Ruegeria sp. Ofav3-42]MCG7519055.1 carbohydrate kinase [Ruegeria sp. Ofav3-42]